MDKESSARKIVQALQKAGFEAYFAGGCVRDKILGKIPTDFDIATSATPEKVQALFPRTIPVGAQFGVILVLEEDTTYEVATFRTEGGYKDGRRPTTVEFATVEEDAKRRDFTVNGLYWDTKKNQVLDFVGGQEDLKKKVIRTIGDPATRFGEDHLRLMRAIRFAMKLGFEIDPQTFKAVQEHAPLIVKVSAERIRDELCKILTSPSPGPGIRLLDKARLLEHILPEVTKMKGVEQPMQYHPEGDVFIHTMMLLDQLSNAPIELAMGALLHDVAKPDTFVRAPDRIRFHGHDKLGAEMSEKILRRLAFSNRQIEIICALVAEHLKFKDAFQMRESTLKRFLSMDEFDLHLKLHRLDCMASHQDLTAFDFCTKKLAELRAAPPPPTKMLMGHDLIALGFKPGPHFSSILRAVEDEILEGRVTKKEEAEAFVLKQFGDQKK